MSRRQISVLIHRSRRWFLGIEFVHFAYVAVNHAYVVARSIVGMVWCVLEELDEGLKRVRRR